MPRLVGIDQRDAARVSEKPGYCIARQNGHIDMTNDQARLIIPRHNSINIHTLGSIAEDAGLTPDQFRSVLASYLYLSRTTVNRKHHHKRDKLRSPEKRQPNRTRPETMLLHGRAVVAAHDFRAVLAAAEPEDVFYMDPAYQGTSGFHSA